MNYLIGFYWGGDKSPQTPQITSAKGKQSYLSRFSELEDESGAHRKLALSAFDRRHFRLLTRKITKVMISFPKNVITLFNANLKLQNKKCNYKKQAEKMYFNILD